MNTQMLRTSPAAIGKHYITEHITIQKFKVFLPLPIQAWSLCARSHTTLVLVSPVQCLSHSSGCICGLVGSSHGTGSPGSGPHIAPKPPPDFTLAILPHCLFWVKISRRQGLSLTARAFVTQQGMDRRSAWGASLVPEAILLLGSPRKATTLLIIGLNQQSCCPFPPIPSLSSPGQPDPVPCRHLHPTFQFQASLPPHLPCSPVRHPSPLPGL